MRRNLIDMKIRSMNINILVLKRIWDKCLVSLKGNVMNYLDGASSKCAEQKNIFIRIKADFHHKLCQFCDNSYIVIQCGNE